MASNISRLDTVYRSLLLTRFFTKGWGRPDDLREIFKLRRQLSCRETALSYVDRNHPVTLTKREIKHDHEVVEGHFVTPFASYLPHLLPPESTKAHFQMILPTTWKTDHRPMCIQYAGTGDHFFWRRRRLMALPMLRERGIASIILENPFYGLRKPKEQLRSSLQQVSDLFIMGACLILESLVLFNWCERQGYWPLISHGISMGGHMASLGATVWPKPMALVPCLSWTSASVTFTKGVMSGAIPWHLMEHQFATMGSYREELAHMIQCEENAFRAGVEYAKRFGSFAPSEDQDVRENSTSQESDLGTSFLDSFQLPFSNQTSSLIETVPLISKFVKSENRVQTSKALKREAMQFMKGIMDECTHLRNYDVPFDPSLIVIVIAENDAYQPREGVAALPDIWPGAALRIIEDKGHVSSYLFKQGVFRKAIYDASDLLISKYSKPS